MIIQLWSALLKTFNTIYWPIR